MENNYRLISRNEQGRITVDVRPMPDPVPQDFLDYLMGHVHNEPCPDCLGTAHLTLITHTEVEPPPLLRLMFPPDTVWAAAEIEIHPEPCPVCYGFGFVYLLSLS